jgi:hypothetical protein
MAGGVAQAIKHLPSEHKARSSNPNSTKKVRRETEGG